MTKGLIVVDMQNDYFPGGAMELVDMKRAADTAAGIIAHFRKTGLPVLHIRHIARQPEAGFFLPGTFGAEINETVLPQGSEVVIEKHFPNSFRDTVLLDKLQEAGVDSLVICGAMSHMCIDATVRAAFDLGFDCIVPEDACATRDLRFKGKVIEADKVHGAFIAAMGACYARIVSADEVVLTILPAGPGL